MQVIDYHLSLFCKPESLGDSEKIPHIVPSAEAFAAAKTLIPPCSRPIALHPGSGSRKKNWPFDRFLAIADHLRSHRIPVLWIRGPAEELFDYPSGDFTATNLPLPVLAALLSQCRACVGNDSGVTHLAAAVGCPTVAIFGPSDPVVWGPRGRNVIIVSNKMQCAPCHGTVRDDPACGNSCLIEISVDDVLDIF
jgi:ADP-heptose:LPS heptosyltransferase